MFVVGLFLIATIQANALKSFPVELEESYSEQNGGRIVGGLEAEPHSVPYLVALILPTTNGKHLCGGSLISKNYVLTAAHCVHGVSSVEVILGGHQLFKNESNQRITSSETILHENWTFYSYDDDLALIKLPSPVTLNENIKLVQLPWKESGLSFEGRGSKVAGWGEDANGFGSLGILRFATSKIISNTQCSWSFPLVKPTHICSSGGEGQSSCTGDSGGPLTVEVEGSVKQIGIVSFRSTSSCTSGNPSVHTRITKYLDWIERNTDVLLR